MKQVVVIGGGNVFPTYNAYLSHLENFEAENIDYFKPRKDWKTNLQKDLGPEYEVLLPQMPHKGCAEYREWRIWFEKIFPFLDDDAGVILVGHSLGAAFLAKYIQENVCPIDFLATFLVAGPYDKNDNRPMEKFTVPNSLKVFKQYGGKIFIYHSEDDPIVPFSELDKYLKALRPGNGWPQFSIFQDRGHFNQETFPELVADIKSL